MSKTRTVLQAGKQIAAIAGGRALKGKPLKTHPKESLNDPRAETQGELGTEAEQRRARDNGDP